MASAEQVEGTMQDADGGAEARLIARCQAKDASAYRAVYDLHVNRVFRVCMALLGDESEAEDATQRVFTTAFRNIHRFEGRSQLSTWLHGIAVGVVANMRRGRWRRARLAAAYAVETRADATAAPHPERRAAARHMLARIANVLAELPEKTRIPFVLYHGAGFDLRAVSEIIGAPQQTTSDRIRAARREIIQRLDTDPLDLPEDGHE